EHIECFRKRTGVSAGNRYFYPVGLVFAFRHRGGVMGGSRKSSNREEARFSPATSGTKASGRPGRPKRSTAVSQSIPLSGAADEGLPVPPGVGDAGSRIAERAYALYQR